MDLRGPVCVVHQRHRQGSLLDPGGQGQASAAGHCINDEYVVHLVRGIEAPAGWSTLVVSGDDFHYLLTPLP